MSLGGRDRNGNTLEDRWRKGVLCAHGGYECNGGDMYVAQWRRGVKWGECILTWALGKSVNGLQHSHGALNLRDCCFSYGRWRKGVVAARNRYYPVHASVEKLNFHTHVVRLKCTGELELVGDECTCMCCRCSRPFLDSLCCRFKDGVGFSERCYDFHPAVLLTDPVNEFPSFELLQFWTPNDQKRPGQVICKGHKSYKLVRALQLGIRYFMDWKMDAPKKELAALDFRNNASIVVRFPSDGARHSSDMFTDFKWKDYRPAVFRHLQELNKINTDEYMLSICGNETLRELTSPGKSGCLLYLSNDDRFVIKTVRKAEKKVLLEMLPNYYCHVQKYENTLLTRFYGLHAVQQSGSHKVYFVVMENIFYSGLRIHKRFDLKGSSQGRCASKVTADESTIFKDLDLDFAFYLDPSMRQKLLRQIKRDCNFLEVEGIMDYSLLLGIHISSTTPRDSPAKESIDGNTLASKTSPRCDSFENRNEETKSCNDLLQNSAAWPDCKLGVRMPAYATPIGNPKSVSRSSRHRATAGKDPNVVLYIGIIDILQGYNMFKRIEHVYKSLQFDSQSISAVNPKVYSSRFQDFLTKVFPIKEQHFLRCDRKSLKQNC